MKHEHGRVEDLEATYYVDEWSKGAPVVLAYQNRELLGPTKGGIMGLWTYEQVEEIARRAVVKDRAEQKRAELKIVTHALNYGESGHGD